MSQFDVKMTELADKIKSKNTAVTGKLSVQGMIEAVNGITAGGAGDSTVKFGYWTADGQFQEVDLSGDSPVDTGSPIVVDAVMFKTGKDSPSYSSWGTMDFYRCASYDNGETIPAYSNLTISGIASPAGVNGNYVISDVSTEGIDRKWYCGDYAVTNSNYTWYIHSTAVTPSKITALYYCEVLPPTTGDGSTNNPVYWDSVITDTSNRWITPVFSIGDYSGSEYKRNFYMKLNAGTAYQIGVTNPDGMDANIILFDLSGAQIQYGDEQSAEINGTSCSDSISYTPSTTGIYRIAAGAYSSGSGNAQVVCYPAPEFAEAPTAVEPWEIEWTVGGAETGAYIITNAGYAPAIGEYTPSTETYDGNTVWTNVHTGAVWKAAFSGSSWRWSLYENASSTSYKYIENNFGSFATPWDVTTQWGYASSSYLPYPTFVKSTGYNATGTPSIAEVAFAERPATGVKLWTGYKATQDTESLKWTVADTLTTGLEVNGYMPIVGRIYSADTTVQVAGLTEDTPGQMVCLAHFDGFKDGSGATFVDGTDTCIIRTQNQSSIKKDKVKFGDGSWYGNYRNVPYEGGFDIIGLPAVSGDFTVEFWHVYTGYEAHGGLILYVYQTVDYEVQKVGELNAISLLANHPLCIKNAWYHHAFVRKDGIVTEYINGVKVNTVEFTATLGGDYSLAVYGGGWGTRDVRNYIDEFAIFNFAKYTSNFTPPFIPYDDIPSGLHTPDTTVGEVSVSGITAITFANSKSYSLVDSSATGSSRVWKTVNGEWYIYFDEMHSSGWVIANTTNPDDANRVEAAYLDGLDQWNIEPIGNASWVDSSTQQKIKVIANS